MRFKIRHINKSDREDYLLSIAVLCQSLLCTVQLFMIYSMSMAPESTTKYRVLGSAVPMIIAILIGARRRPTLFFATYSVVVSLLALHSLFFPDNVEIILAQSIRYLMPIVIPSALCTMCIRNIRIFEETLYFISWSVVPFLLVIVARLLTGAFVMEAGYDMSLSYALLLPMLVLYKKKGLISVGFSFLIFMIILAVGSRGAAVIFCFYVIYDILFNHKRLIPFFIAFVIGFFLLLPVFASILEEYGISSRTLWLLMEKDYLHSSDRDLLYDAAARLLKEHPLVGGGLFGDRVFGAYVHNFPLEVMIDFGVPLGILLLFIFACLCIRAYVKADKGAKDKFVMFFLCFVVPLFVSGSYLIDYGFGTFIGVLYLMQRRRFNRMLFKPINNKNNNVRCRKLRFA